MRQAPSHCHATEGCCQVRGGGLRRNGAPPPLAVPGWPEPLLFTELSVVAEAMLVIWCDPLTILCQAHNPKVHGCEQRAAGLTWRLHGFWDGAEGVGPAPGCRSASGYTPVSGHRGPEEEGGRKHMVPPFCLLGCFDTQCTAGCCCFHPVSCDYVLLAAAVDTAGSMLLPPAACLTGGKGLTAARQRRWLCGTEARH